MDLEIKEVSELLNVPEETLFQWISEGKIPAYSIQDRYRFNRAEIEDWVMQQKLQEDPEGMQATKKSGQLTFNLFRAIHKGEVFSDIEGDDKLSIIKATMKRLAPRLKLDPDVLTEVIMEREELMPTAVGGGFGIPHARDFLLKGQQDIVACVFLQKPIEYGALDGTPVHTLFFLLASDDKKHLSLLAKIAHLIANPEMQKQLATKPDKAKLLEMIQHWEANLKVN
jgi:nitrogen PTS system EIIA component